MGEKDSYKVNQGEGEVREFVGIVRPEEKGGFAGFREFLWNSQTKEFLGRTGSSWAKITVFYIIFYAALAAFFAMCMAIFLQTLDETSPKWQGDNGIIGSNPGLGFRPAPPDEFIDSTLIWFRGGSSESDKKHWEHWHNRLVEFWKPYAQFRENAGQFIQDCSFADPKTENEDKVCFFDVKTISQPCYPESFFGYDLRQPCVMLKLNKIYGWIPEPYDNVSDLPDHMPTQLKETIKENAAANGGVPQKMVWLSCEGENPADKENIGTVTYSPMQGFPHYYFPFRRTPGYLPPFVAVNFQRPEQGVLINVECRAWAKNIRHDRMERIGGTHFELLMD